MTREDALTQLASGTAHERLSAARFLESNAHPSDVDAIRKALQRERVSYVRSRLRITLKKISSSALSRTLDSESDFDVPPEVREQIKSEAVEDVTRQILHEISSPVGLLASAVSREIPDFDNSKSKIYVDKLKRVFNAIEQLKTAAGVAKPREFDLSDLISEIVIGEVSESAVNVSEYGPKPLLVISDPDLLSLSLANGIRNAVESVGVEGSEESHPVTVTWGETDVDYWVSVIDRGGGVVGPTESAFAIGASTKQNHSGFGLTIARQAMETLGGSCSLRPAVDGGAHFEIRWEK